MAAGSLTCPHPPQRRDTSWYSVTFGGGGGWTSTTWRRTRAVSAAPCNDSAHRHSDPERPRTSHPGHQPNSATPTPNPAASRACDPTETVTNASSRLLIPRRIRRRGRDDVEESLPKRRSSSTIRSACSVITRFCCTTTDSSSRTRPSNRSTNASNYPESDTPRSSQATISAPVATHRDHQPAEQLRLAEPE